MDLTARLALRGTHEADTDGRLGVRFPNARTCAVVRSASGDDRDSHPDFRLATPTPSYWTIAPMRGSLPLRAGRTTLLVRDQSCDEESSRTDSFRVGSFKNAKAASGRLRTEWCSSYPAFACACTRPRAHGGRAASGIEVLERASMWNVLSTNERGEMFPGSVRFPEKSRENRPKMHEGRSGERPARKTVAALPLDAPMLGRSTEALRVAKRRVHGWAMFRRDSRVCQGTAPAASS